jgi:hypothetical protein
VCPNLACDEPARYPTKIQIRRSDEVCEGSFFPGTESEEYHSSGYFPERFQAQHSKPPGTVPMQLRLIVNSQILRNFVQFDTLEELSQARKSEKLRKNYCRNKQKSDMTVGRDPTGHPGICFRDAFRRLINWPAPITFDLRQQNQTAPFSPQPPLALSNTVSGLSDGLISLTFVDRSSDAYWDPRCFCPNGGTS